MLECYTLTSGETPSSTVPVEENSPKSNRNNWEIASKWGLFAIGNRLKIIPPLPSDNPPGLDLSFSGKGYSHIRYESDILIQIYISRLVICWIVQFSCQFPSPQHFV